MARKGPIRGGFMHWKVLIGSNENAGYISDPAEELPEEDVGADLPPCLDGDVLHGQIIRAHFEQFQEEALVYSPHFGVACSNLTLGQGKYTTQPSRPQCDVLFVCSKVIALVLFVN